MNNLHNLAQPAEQPFFVGIIILNNDLHNLHNLWRFAYTLRFFGKAAARVRMMSLPLY